MEANLSTRFKFAPSSAQIPLHHHQFDHSVASRTILDLFPPSAPPEDIESALSSAGISIPPPPSVVEQVLKLYYHAPWFAIKFFGWAGSHGKHATSTWNIMVDLLGKNRLFEPMWDAVRSMKEDKLLSPATFVSMFKNYCAAGRYHEAIMSFDVMDRYGVPPDVAAVNSLLAAICSQENQTSTTALEFFEKKKAKIPLNGETFAILLQGLEKEGNVAKAKTTFGEMVVRVGWSPQNMAAYDAFLTTLVRGSQLNEALKFLQVMKGNNCLPGLKFFSNTIDVLVVQNNLNHAIPLWNMMVGNGLLPNVSMYNAMIGLLCNNNAIDSAYQFLDEMSFHGSFPDSLTYNLIFQCLIKNKRVREVGKFFVEMIKNECPPTHTNFAAAIAMLLEGDDPEMAVEIWDFMVDNGVKPIDESANALLLGFCNLGRLLELQRFVEDMLDRRINIVESTMAKMKTTFYKKGRKATDTYDSLSRRWKGY